MYDRWAVLSQKSRIELLAGDRNSYDRIEHRPGWINQLRERVQAIACENGVKIGCCNQRSTSKGAKLAYWLSAHATAMA